MSYIIYHIIYLHMNRGMYVYICKHIYICICIYTYIYICMYIHIYIYIQMYIHMYICNMYIYIYVTCIYNYIIYIYICIHVHMISSLYSYFIFTKASRTSWQVFVFANVAQGFGEGFCTGPFLQTQLVFRMSCGRVLQVMYQVTHG